MAASIPRDDHRPSSPLIGLDVHAWLGLVELVRGDEVLLDRVARRYYELTASSIFDQYRCRCASTMDAGYVVGRVRCVREAHPGDREHIY